MTVHMAKTAGFCFGVDKAVRKVEELIAQGRKVFTFGPIIHNPQVTADFEAKGVVIAQSPDDVKSGGVLVIRSHGVPKSVYDELSERSVEYVDATCPFVAKIHSIVAKASSEGQTVLIAGDSYHPEVLGISGHCSGRCLAFANADELDSIINSDKISSDSPLTVVAQTTFNKESFEICVEKIKKVYTNATIFATICNATLNRQREATEISQKCDLMLVVGGRNSSNTRKLFEICSENTKAFLVESADELPESAIKAANDIGITAGASTPAGIIKEVLESMAEINSNDENFAALLEESFKNSNTNGKVVEGTVVGIAPSEIYVDVGRKQSGVVTLEELTDNPNLTPEDIVKTGDKLELMILRTNDQEGYIYLSKRILDANRSWEEIKAAAPKIVNRARRGRDDSDEDVFHADEENAESAAEAAPVDEVIEKEPEGDPIIFSGVVTEVVKGGVIVSYKGVKVFIPAGQATMSRGEPLESLIRKEIKFIVLEVNPGRRRAVGSIRAVLNKERKAKEKEFWETIDVGQVFTGTVKSLTTYGAFVDLGAVDGMVHISELSWNRIKHPSEVINVGDVVEVYVKKVDKEKKKISLGYRKTEDNPWEILRTKYPVGTVIEAPIVGTPDFGAFVRIVPGIDGLVHISQLSNTHVIKPTDVVSVGDIIRAVITEIDFDKKRVSLSVRKLLDEASMEEQDEQQDEQDEEPEAGSDAE